MGNYKLELELKTIPPSLNQLLSKGWRFRHFNFLKIKNEIKNQCSGQAPTIPLTNFKISINRLTTKQLDIDNFISSLKPVLDGLVMAGVIQDDNWQLLNKLQFGQEKIKGKENQRLQVTIEEKQ
jgi:Holliday junction resolvase RusA-like endonuclease